MQGREDDRSLCFAGSVISASHASTNKNYNPFFRDLHPTDKGFKSEARCTDNVLAPSSLPRPSIRSETRARHSGVTTQKQENQKQKLTNATGAGCGGRAAVKDTVPRVNSGSRTSAGVDWGGAKKGKGVRRQSIRKKGNTEPARMEPSFCFVAFCVCGCLPFFSELHRPANLRYLESRTVCARGLGDNDLLPLAVPQENFSDTLLSPSLCLFLLPILLSSCFHLLGDFFQALFLLFFCPLWFRFPTYRSGISQQNGEIDN